MSPTSDARGTSRRTLLLTGGAASLVALSLAACGGGGGPEGPAGTDYSTPDPDRPKEAPMLTEMVEDGELPPLEERLPAEEDRLVVEAPEYGVYGGDYQGMTAGQGDEVWFNRMIGFEPMLRPTPELTEMGEPGILKEAEVDEEGIEYTLRLREGLLWSDGEPVTADDVMFAIEDIYLNEEIHSVPPEILAVQGEPAEAERLDDYTVQLTFPSSKGNFIDLASRELLDGNFFFYPKHYFEDYLPHLNDEAEDFAEEEGFNDWIEHLESRSEYYNNPEKPTVLPWVVVDPLAESNVVAFERNPYYWKVDDDGAQLPYIDRMEFEVVQDEEVMLLKTLNGEIDFHARHIDSVVNRPVLAEGREEGDYEFASIQSSSMNPLIISLNLNHEDDEMRELFQDKDFRIGLSHAIDRQEIIDTVYQRQGEPWQAAPAPGSVFHDEEFGTQYTEFDVDLANEHLDEAGLTETDSDGFRLLPSGEPVRFNIDTITGRTDDVNLVTEYWQEVGIDARVNTIERTLFYDRKDPAANEYDANAWSGDGGLHVEMIDARWYFPFSDESNFAPRWAEWFITRGGGESMEEPPEAPRRQMELYWELLEEPDVDRQDELAQEILDIAKEEFYVIGIALPAEMYAIVSNDMRNVPEQWVDSPVYNSPGPQNPSTWFFDRE